MKKIVLFFGVAAVCVALFLFVLWLAVKPQLDFTREEKLRRGAFMTRAGAENAEDLAVAISRDASLMSEVSAALDRTNHMVSQVSTKWHAKASYPLWLVVSVLCTRRPPEQVSEVGQFAPGIIGVVCLAGIAAACHFHRPPSSA